MAKWCRRNHFEPCDYLFSCCGRSVSSNDCSVWLVAVFCVILPLFGVVFHSCCCCFVFLTTTETGNMRYSPFFLFLSAFDSPTWFDCCLFVGSGPFWWRMTLFWRRVAVFGARRHVVVVFGGSFLSASFSFRSPFLFFPAVFPLPSKLVDCFVWEILLLVALLWLVLLWLVVVASFFCSFSSSNFCCG